MEWWYPKRFNGGKNQYNWLVKKTEFCIVHNDILALRQYFLATNYFGVIWVSDILDKLYQKSVYRDEVALCGELG